MKNLFLLAMLFISLCAKEAIQRAHEEVGLTDSTQVGRYKVLITAPENAETFDQAFDPKSAYFGIAYNRVFTGNNASVTDGFGSGPYYTSLNKQTIGSASALAPGKDLNANRLNLGFELTPLGIKGLNIELLHGHFTLVDSPVEVEENDVALSYDITDRWHLESIYSTIDYMNIDYTNPDNRVLRDFQRLITRLDYCF